MRYAISDIHGCPKTLRLALDQIDLKPTDELYLLGDYIDRGPDSQGVIDLIWELESEGYQLVCLMGNHEEMLIDYDDSKSFLYEWQPAPENYNRVLTWMRALPRYHLIPGYILVHAGLNFRHINPLEDKEAMLWIRYWYGDVDREWLGTRTVVHGHTPATMLQTKAGIDYMEMNKYACIDSGCSQRLEGMGYLTVLNLDTKKGIYVRRID